MSATIEVGDRLPDIDLPARDGGAPFGFRTPRDGTTVLLFPPTSGVADASCLHAFARAADDFRLWDGRPLPVVASSEQAAALALGGAGADIRIGIDSGGELRRVLGLEDTWWGLFLADRWGVLYDVVRTPDVGELPSTGEIKEWLKFLATQCPECGVIDDPNPGWNPP